jgi:predicted nucleic acid-binding protein
MRQEDEETKVQQLLALFTHIDLDFAVAWHGGEIQRHYQTRLADALIAATALGHNLRLATRNLQHFTPIEGLRIENPYD